MTKTSKYLEKLKLRTLKYFVDSLTGNLKELEKVFLLACRNEVKAWPMFTL